MKLPDNTSIKQCFWSYRFSDLDTENDKHLIIKQVLEFGDVEAIKWLGSAYDRNTIENVIRNSMASEWSNKTRSYLDVVYGVSPARSMRFK